MALTKEENARRRAIKTRLRKTKARETLLSLLGAKCKHCGFCDKRALQIDHVNGGGIKDRARRGGNYYSSILNDVLGGSLEFQILCANCNTIKKVEQETVAPIHTGDVPETSLRPCGTHSSYHRGCRCDLCRDAHRVYCRVKMKERYDRNKNKTVIVQGAA